MLNAHPFFRRARTGLAVTVLLGPWSGSARAQAYIGLGCGSFGVQLSAGRGVSYAPVSTGLQFVGMPGVVTTAIAAPTQLQLVGQVPYQAVSMPLQTTLTTASPSMTTV